MQKNKLVRNPGYDFCQINGDSNFLLILFNQISQEDMTILLN